MLFTAQTSAQLSFKEKIEKVKNFTHGLDYGTSKCPDSPTLEEGLIHSAILKGLSGLIENKNEVKDELKAALGTGITVCAGELIDDNSPQYGSATAQELAADILGLNLDFDLNTGSGYVVSLLGNYYEYCEDVRISQAFQCDVSLGCPVVLCYDEDHGKVWLERSPIFGENEEKLDEVENSIREWGVHSCRSIDEFNQYLRCLDPDAGFTEQYPESGDMSLC